MSQGYWDTDALMAQMHKAQVEAAQKAFEEAKIIASSELARPIAEELQGIYDEAVATWYQSYIPYKYNRTHKLYQVMTVEDLSSAGDINIRYAFSDDALHYPSWGKGSFDPYTQIFEVGFHGGWIPTSSQNVGEHVDGAAEIMGGYRWPVQSTPIPELFEDSKKELEAVYSSKFASILARETAAGYNRYFNFG